MCSRLTMESALSDSASDALLDGFIDLLKEVAELQRILLESGTQSEQGAAQTSPDPVVVAQSE